MSIYLSNWTPRGVRKTYERCAVSNSDAKRLLADYGRGNVIDACGWFDADEVLRVLVADTDTGHRFTVRSTKKNWSITSERRSAALSEPAQ